MLEISCDGDFRNRKGQFPVSNPQAGSAARVIASDDIDAESHHFRDKETVADARDDLFGGLDALVQIKVPVPDARVAGDAARSVGGSFHAQLASCVRI